MNECPTCGKEYSDHGVKIHHSRQHGERYHAAIIRSEYGQEPDVWLRQEHREKQRSLASIAEELGTTNSTVKEICEDQGVGTRSYSDAQSHLWEGRDESERKAQLQDAHEKTRELADSGEHNFQDEDFDRVLTPEFIERAKENDVPDELREWWEENEHKRKEFGSRAAESRETNGMAGKTGQDNPNWRGGKNVLDAVKKQLGPYWKQRREEAKERDGYECQNCGATDVKLDTHHIVPVMSGGTHGFWNLMTLCEECHTKAEWFTRQYPEFDSVLVE